MKILEDNTKRGKLFKGLLKVRCSYCKEEFKIKDNENIWTTKNSRTLSDKNSDLEVRLVIDSHNGEEYNKLINKCIDTTQVYVEEEFNNLVNNKDLTK